MHGAVRRGGIVRPAKATRAVRPVVHLLLAAVFTLACGGDPPPPHRSFLRDLVVAPVPGGATTCPGPGAETAAAEPRSVVRDHSRREAVVTCEGVSLQVDLDRSGPSIVDLAVARVPGSAGRGDATVGVELHRDGARELLLEEPVPAEGWAEHRIELPKRGAGRLLLRSAGGATVAWTDLHVAPAAPDGSRAAAGAADGRPSLILVSLDTVRADHLSLYGYHRPTTPRLEELGRESLVFTRALSSATWTLPSTATLLSGLLPAQHGALHVSKRLGPDVVTVAERLRDAGYRTAALTDGGFAGFPFGFAQGFDRYDVTPGKAWQAREKDAAKTFNEAAAWLLHNRHHPFFLFLHTYETHQPYVNREGFADPYLAPGDRGQDLSVMLDPHFPERTPEELARLVALYDGEITRTDHYLGVFLDTLEEAGLADQVAILVTSDHGEEFLEHGDLEHAFGKVFDPNVHVPLVVKPPAGRDVAPGRLSTPVSGIDVAPTLLDLAGLPHDDLPGRSLLDPALAGEEDPRPTFVHGIPSFPSVTAERFRIDAAGTTAVLDRPDADTAPELLRYDTGAGAVEPWPGAPGEAPVPRLASLVAWSEAGSLFASLPEDARHLAVPRGSRIRPRALWTGRSWRALEGDLAAALEPGEAGLELAPEGPHLLVFDLAEGGGPWEAPWTLSLAQGGQPSLQPYRLTAERRPAWNPLTDPLPPEGAVQPTANLRPPTAAPLDEETAKELKALGYLQ